MYQILRMEKLKSVYSMRRSMAHAYRDQDTPNADPARFSQNQYAGPKTSAEAISRYNERLSTVKGRVRKNAVFALEYLVTASPEWFEGRSIDEQTEYFNDALKWLKAKHGADNFISAGVHRDEKTPHLYAYFIPLKDRKLNAKHFVGGHREILAKMQTDFHENVSKKYGLERGMEGSQAKHTAVKKWYSMIADAMDLPKTTKMDQLRRVISGSLDETLRKASAIALEAKLAKERAYGQVMAARRALKQAQGVTERLAMLDKLEAALDASELKAAHFEREYRNLKDIFEIHGDDIKRFLQEKFGYAPAEPEPEALPPNQEITIDASLQQRPILTPRL